MDMKLYSLCDFYHIATYESNVTACGLNKAYGGVSWDLPCIWMTQETSGEYSGSKPKCPTCRDSDEAILMTLGDLP